MTERHHYKYIVLDSSKENGNAVQAKFNVQVPHGITNASRVCVKSFSMPNVIHNVYGDFKKVRFVEFYRPTASANWVYDVFNLSLPDGYDETSDLVTSLQGKFTNTSGNEIIRESDGTATFTHAGQSDTATTVTLTHDTNSYKNTLVFDSGSQHKAIALLVEDQNTLTIWESLGFKKEQILKVSEIAGMRDRLNALASDAGADVIANDVMIGGLRFIRGGITTSSIVHRTLVSPHAGTHENHNGIYIASQMLGNDTMVGLAHSDNVMVAHQSDVLQFINNDVPKYSYLTYHTDTPMWNVLTKKDINYFDVEIRDHRGHLYPRSALADFLMVIMFETIEEMEYNKDDIIAYNAMAYKLGHPTSSGFSVQ